MLVYIAQDALEEVLCPVTDDMIPFSLSNRFREERSVEEIERHAKDHAHEFATVNVLLDEDFYGFEVISKSHKLRELKNFCIINNELRPFFIYSAYLS